ncbi:hypothetical protein [Kineococcus rhizosphaerae]|uniref:Uncharacterized protein n=1 Tax=Kineococcus rhizosphaerae TaxID=559628 RepID=A0A2T0QNB7_9ACTN|nr:hypothetical protein [Kineococcus rhizosphaerae]PRY06099.1 hypothetical protein CLV37_13514 [Kineococcus rhizosphaerae]
MVATALLAGMLLLAFVRPDVSPFVLSVIGGSGLALFGIDVPWSSIPWGLLLGGDRSE